MPKAISPLKKWLKFFGLMSILVNVEELCLIKHQKVWRCWTVTTRYQKKPTNYFSHDFLISGLNTNLAGHSAQCTVKNEPKKWIRSAKTAKRHTASGLCKLITKLPSFDTYTSKTFIRKEIWTWISMCIWDLGYFSLRSNLNNTKWKDRTELVIVTQLLGIIFPFR